MRRLVCIFLLLLLPLHAYATQGGISPLGKKFDLAHEIEHLDGANHHHHGDDGSVHYDDSSESAQHHAEHANAGQAMALPSTITPQFALTARTAVRVELREYIPDHVPEQPQCPPQVLG